MQDAELVTMPPSSNAVMQDSLTNNFPQGLIQEVVFSLHKDEYEN
jgi:hypothetical protein